MLGIRLCGLGEPLASPTGVTQHSGRVNDWHASEQNPSCKHLDR
jgi:hypothetical protein